MHHVFVSYSRLDAETVRPIASQLIGAGIPVWIDESDIPFAIPWRDEVKVAIRGAAIVLVCDSVNWYGSPNCADELAVAVNMAKPVVHADVGSESGNAVVSRVLDALKRLDDDDRLSTDLLAAATEWARAGQPGFLLDSGSRARAYLKVLPPSVALEAPETQSFIVASRRRAQRRAAAGAVAAVATAGLALAALLLPGVDSGVRERLDEQTRLLGSAAVNEDLMAYDRYAALDRLASDAGSAMAFERMARLAELLSEPLPSSREPYDPKTLERVTGSPDAPTLLIASASRRTDDVSGRVAVLEANGSVTVQGADGGLLRRIVVPGVASAIAWRPDGRILAVGHGTIVDLIAVDSGRSTMRLDGSVGGVTGVVWSPDGVRLTAVTDLDDIVTWETRRPAVADHPSNWTMAGVGIPGTNLLATVTRDSKLVAVGPNGTTTERDLGHGVASNIAADARTGSLGALTLPDGSDQWELTLVDGSLDISARVPLPDCSATDLALDGGHAFVTCLGGSVLRVDEADLSVVRNDDTREDWVGVTILSNDVILRSRYGAYFAADLGLTTAPQHMVSSPSFGCSGASAPLAASLDGVWLVAGGTGAGNIGCAHRATIEGEGEGEGEGLGLAAATIPWIDARSSQAVAISPDGTYAAWGFDDGSVWVFDLMDMNVLIVDRTLSTAVRGLAFSPQDDRLLAAARDGEFVSLPLDGFQDGVTAQMDKQVSQARKVVDRAVDLGFYVRQFEQSASPKSDG